MTRKTRTATLLASAAAALLLAQAAIPNAARAADDPVVATVNGDAIRMSDLLRSESRLPPRLRASPPAVTLPLLITLSIDQRLLAKEARRQGLDGSEEIKDQVRFMEELVLEQALLRQRLAKDLTPAAVKARYDAFVAETRGQEQVRARHILLENEADAEDVIKALQDGADFEKLAAKRSIGPTKETGGDLGYFNRRQMVPEFSEAAFALKPGTFTRSPVKTQFGWHVIKVEDRRKLEPPPFAEVEDQLREEMGRELRASYLEALRAQADIERFDNAAKGTPLPQNDKRQ